MLTESWSIHTVRALSGSGTQTVRLEEVQGSKTDATLGDCGLTDGQSVEEKYQYERMSDAFVL